jgi:anti-sigma regulatory factor (Ser/Thr protein kinase)
MKYSIRAGDIEHGGSASARIKAELTRAGVDTTTARRAGIVAFEGEMNLIVYSDEGGTLSVTIEPNAVVVEVQDQGPGIEDLDLAMTPGYSTAPSWATDLGFGAGMGLVNMQKHSDQFTIHSRIGEGTTVRCWIERKGDWAMHRQEDS